jgi:hypothetical protein
MTSRRVIQSLVSGVRNRITTSRQNVKKSANSVWDAYEDLIGIRETRRTHESVLSAENMFVAASKARREVQSRLSDIQQSLKQVRQKLGESFFHQFFLLVLTQKMRADSTSRTDETYLELVTREHQLFKEESKLAKELIQQENVERDLFNTFSQNVRNCQEVERMRQEKTKYLSLMGSLIGAALGIIGTSINHALKNKDFKKILQAIQSHKDTEQSDFNEGEHDMNLLSKDVIEDVVKEVSSRMIQHMDKQEQQPQSEIMDRIRESESILQHQMRLNAICTITATYILIAVTLPLISRLCGN